MTPEERIVYIIEEIRQDGYEKGHDDASGQIILKNSQEDNEYLQGILSIKVPKKVAECPECKGNGYTLEMQPIGNITCPVQIPCATCETTGSITQEFTIKELIEGDYLK